MNQDNDKSVTWFEFIFFVIANTLLMIPNNLIVIVMFPIIGALGGWLLGLTPVGAWIAGGFRLIHVDAQATDLYRFGALFGFVRSFLLKGNTSVESKKYWIDRIGKFAI